MKALLDAHLSPRLAVVLRDRGYDVLAAQKLGLTSAPDEQVVDAAAAENRAIVTADVGDYRRIAATRLQTDRSHPGLLLITSGRLTARDAIGILADAVATVMRAHPDGLTDREVWIAASSR